MKLIGSKHPYVGYEDSDLWNTIQRAIRDLIENKDLVLCTKAEYVVGYICKVLAHTHPHILDNTCSCANPRTCNGCKSDNSN